MKKYLSLLLLCAAVFFTSCEEHDYADDMVGKYSFEETGVLTLAGQTEQVSAKGEFTISRSEHNKIVFTGDITGKGTVMKDGSGFWIDDDKSDFTTTQGIKYHYDNSYYNGRRYATSISWETNSLVTATYNGQTFNGAYKAYTIAKKK